MEKLIDAAILVLTKVIELISKKKTLKQALLIRNIYTDMAVLVHGRINDITPYPIYQCVVLEFSEVGKAAPKKNSKMGVQYIVNCLYSQFRHPVTTFMRYSDIRCDGVMMDLLVKTLEENTVRIKVDMLKKDSIMHMLLATESIKYAELHLLHEKAGNVYVLLVSTVDMNQTFTDVEVRKDITIGAQRLASTLKKM